MRGPYVRRTSWPDFTYGGVTYSLAHLDEYVFTVVDTAGVERQVGVTFSDHCFTRDPLPGDDPALAYPDSDRRPGHFSFDRYALSKDIRAHIAQAIGGYVWTLRGESFAVIRTVDRAGHPTYHGIVFSLDRVKGLQVDLRMRVRTAFPYTEGEPETFGRVRFRNLVELRMKGKLPPPVTGARRRWPKLR